MPSRVGTDSVEPANSVRSWEGRNGDGEVVAVSGCRSPHMPSRKEIPEGAAQPGSP